jgi:hypothetical protein
MTTELENGKEWARRTAANTLRSFGVNGEIEWISKDKGTLLLMLRSGESATEVMSFDELQLRRATYDFDTQYSLGIKIRSAVKEVRLLS